MWTRVICLLMFSAILYVNTGHAYAESGWIPGLDVNIGTSNDPQDTAGVIKIIILMTVLAVSPAILVMMTCFTRIIIVLSFVRSGLATQQMPPNQVLIGLAMFMTFFVMSPVISDVNQNALQPYLDNKISQTQAFDRAAVPIKKFMAKHTREQDLALFMNYMKKSKPKSIQDIPITALVPAYAISELKTAFQIGFMIFIPFLVIDFVVASILMGMGMMMLPPVMISLPFKVLLFVLVDGWYLVIKSLLVSLS